MHMLVALMIAFPLAVGIGWIAVRMVTYELEGRPDL
jgi:hypothetical protein